jgi:hypothetical protein
MTPITGNESCEFELQPIDPKFFFVAPRNGTASRLAIFKDGDVEHRDQINTDKAPDRRKFFRGIAEKSGRPIGELMQFDQMLCDLADDADARVISEAERDVPTEEPESELEDWRTESHRIYRKTGPAVTEAAAKFLVSKNMFGQLATHFAEIGIVGELPLALAVFVVATSRLLKEPLGAIVKAATATGKSFVSNAIMSLMPPEQLLRATDLTPQFLFYCKPGSLRHKLVSVAERKHGDARNEAGIANAGLAIREMISSGEIRKSVTVTGNGQPVSVEIHQEGPIAYLETTTQETIFEEDENRLLRLTTDESCEQTERIMRHQACVAAGRSTRRERIEFLQQVHQTAQRMLAPLEVRIPFAEYLAIPTTKLEARRAFLQLLVCIRVIALLRQYQKPESPEGYIEADVADYRIAYGIMLPILRRVFAPLSEHARELHQQIRRQCSAATFTRRDCQDWTALGLTSVRKRLDLLVDYDLIVQVSGGPGQTYSYRLNPSADFDLAGPCLPGLISPDDLHRRLAAEESHDGQEATAV